MLIFSMSRKQCASRFKFYEGIKTLVCLLSNHQPGKSPENVPKTDLELVMFLLVFPSSVYFLYHCFIAIQLVT